VSHILTFPLSVDAPRQARRSFDRYTGTIEEALLDDLRLLSSEIVTNAVQHSGCPRGDPLRIEVTTARDLIRVEVIDGGKRTRPVRPRSQTPASGLQYVALLSDRWSSGATNSFRVWFEIDIQASGLIRRKRPRPA
jgi:anti-sigma regulatory factor (Ser/Thr protein kinase)